MTTLTKCGILLVSDGNPLTKAILCDIDGTLAIIGNRSPYDERRCYLDSLNHPVAKVICAYQYANSNNALILLSGRREFSRKATNEWLIKNNINYTNLFMRKDDDKRPDEYIKREIYFSEIAQHYDVEFVIDDRLKVIRMWEGLGLFVFNVNQGNREF